MTEASCAIVLCGDSNPDIALGLAVTIYSALANLSDDCRPDLYIIDCGITDEAKRRLARVAAGGRSDVEVHWVDFDPDVLDAIPNRSPFPPVIFARLFMAELIPPSVRRVVYLDADLLVQRDLSSLLLLDLGGSPIAAVRDLGIGSVGAGDQQRAYFNSGVLVVDTAAYRQAGIKELALDYAASGGRARFPDQDSLNAVVDSWVELDYSWNLQIGGLAFGLGDAWLSRKQLARLYSDLRRGAVVLHFTTGFKPWSRLRTRRGSLRWALWLARSDWFSQRELARWLSGWFVASAVAHLRLRIGTKRLQLHNALLDRLRS
ncbi:glycosyltransferase family 8 protein [Conexibacter sp. S30A1]|uniref:glycosyltransferase family 8 protein n=1 Tax=Conexibacter sp. S30A1 TaxID=2937800 RepID=UPI00200C24D0|nr:glycosyltransferase family 8 protein [Conexibacter sp. S30A1]